LFHAHEKLEYLDQESHALWTHLEGRLDIFWRAQVFEIRDLSLNILVHAHELLSKRVLQAWIPNNDFESFFSFNFIMA
jgi:hypothetical protein